MNYARRKNNRNSTRTEPNSRKPLNLPSLENGYFVEEHKLKMQILKEQLESIRKEHTFRMNILTKEYHNNEWYNYYRNKNSTAEHEFKMNILQLEYQNARANTSG